MNLRRFRAMFRRGKLDAEMSEEMRAHLELQAAENEKRGMSADEARARIGAQATDDQRRAVADFVLVNDGTVAQLRDAVEALWREHLVPAAQRTA